MVYETINWKCVEGRDRGLC